jgi:uncharacterized damage-inducible protein DinB
MTYYGAIELAAAFRTVRGNTIQIAEEIPEERYGFQAAPGMRTVAQLLVHIAVTPRMAEQIHFREQRGTLEGFDFFAFAKELRAAEETVRTKAEILELLRTSGERFAGLLENVSEEFLAERVQYPAGMEPPSKTRFEMLMGAKEHEMHHRGQLMVLERMVGVVPHLTRRMEAFIAARAAEQKTT